ncbi:MAG: sigma factor-like helix-turn-helix DNA-binding protein [Candidatus Paceibacterota bacterium]
MKKSALKPKLVVKRLLSALSPRAKEILTSRYGLGEVLHPLTLEAIGKKYGITRERVRQIENHALELIQKSDVLKKEQEIFEALKEEIDELGGLVSERELLGALSKDKSTRNHFTFLLTVGEFFVHEKESAEFHHRWHIDQALAKQVQNALRKLYQNLSDDDLVPESDLIAHFLSEVQGLNEKYRNEEIARRWLSLSKTLDKNPLGEWGKAESPNVKAKGMRDYAYLVIKRHGSPMHFREVAHSITELFDRKAHEATCHNELIKDSRFVLVGRGLYALSEWGYSTGVVKDVIKDILEKNGPLSRSEIIDLVKKERYVKDNTIIVNLQDGKLFVREGGGRYTLK